MQYSTNYRALLVIIIFAGGVGYFIYTQATRDQSSIINVATMQKKINTTQEKPTGISTEKIGDLIVNYDNSVTVGDSDTTQFRRFDVNKIFLLSSNTGVSFTRTKKFPFSISYHKDVNQKKQSIETWWNEYDPQNIHQASYPSEENTITLGKINSYKTIFYSPQSSYDAYVYDAVVVFIPYKTDVYEIIYYKLPEKPGPVLTSADIQAAREYETIINHILETLTFSE